MAKNIYRQKLINAVLFFAEETNQLGMTKLMKLLNFFDFEHFNETGYPAIGLEYLTFEKGPVSKDFWLEIKDATVPEDINSKIAVIVKQDDYDSTKKRYAFRPRSGVKPDMTIFSPREQTILKRLAEIYRDATADMMSEISHQDNKPWQITMEKKGLNQVIDYILALDQKSPVQPERAEENLQEHMAILKAFGIQPVEKAK